MTESYTYIKNARLIDSHTANRAYSDLLIKNATAQTPARIIGIGDPELPKNAKISITDAKGAYACPGFVDLFAHLGALGSKGDAPAVLEAARKGGYSLALIPSDDNSSSQPAPTENSSPKLEFLTRADANKCANDHGKANFYDDGTLNPASLREVMRFCAQNNKTLFVRCVERSMSLGVMNEGERSHQMKIASIPSISEELALAKYLMLSKDTECKIHVHAVSTKNSVSMIRQAKSNGVSVTCDTCPQYFSLTDDQILFKGTAAKVDPPLRSIDDVSAVIEGLADGTIDAISTDHTPCESPLKRKPLSEAPFGMIMLECALLVGITNLVEKGYLSIHRLVDAMCYAPMRILGMEPADALGLNLFTTGGETYASKTLFAGGYSNCAFEGWHFSGKIIKFFPCVW